MSLKRRLLILYLTPSVLMIVTISLLLYFHYQVILINVRYVQQGLLNDRNNMTLSSLARIKQTVELQYEAIVSDLYLGAQIHELVTNNKVALRTGFTSQGSPSLNINMFQSGTITSQQSKLYTKNNLLFDFWYLQEQNDITKVSLSAQTDFDQSLVSSFILRNSAKIARNKTNYPSYTHYFIESQLLKIIPPSDDASNLIERVNNCTTVGDISRCYNQFSETYKKNKLWHTLPTDYETQQGFSNLCTPTYKQNILELPYSILCQEIPLSNITTSFSSLNSSSGLNIVVLDPYSKREVYNNQKTSLNASDNFNTMIEKKELTTASIVEAIKKYDIYLKNFQLSDNPQDSSTEQLSGNGVEAQYETQSGEQNYLVQQIVIKYKDRVTNTFQKYNLYNVISWIDEEYLSENTTELVNYITRFILASYLVCAFVLFFVLGISLLYAVNMQIYTENPIIDLTKILNGVNTDIFNETKENHFQENHNFQLDVYLNQIQDTLATCQELKVLFEVFKQLFQTIQYANEAYFSGDSASSIMHWAQAFVFFQKTDNIRAQGISLNNLGNIHFKEERYDEALECYESSINLAEKEINKYVYLNQDSSSQFIENNTMKDSYSIKLNRMLQYLQALKLRYHQINDMSSKQENFFKVQEEFNEFFFEKINLYKQEILESIKMVDIDMKRDFVCYLILARCFSTIKRNDIAQMYLSYVDNIIEQLSNQQDFQSEMYSSPQKQQTTNIFEAGLSNYQSLSQTPLSIIEIKKPKRNTAQTQISLMQFDEQYSSMIIPPPAKQSNSSISTTLNNQISYQNVSERRSIYQNNQNRSIKQLDEKGYAQYNKAVINHYHKPSQKPPTILKPYPQIIQQRYSRLAKKSIKPNNLQIPENIQKEEDQDLDDEQLNNDMISIIPTMFEVNQLNNPFNLSGKAIKASKDKNLLEDLSQNLPLVPSFTQIKDIIGEHAKENTSNQIVKNTQPNDTLNNENININNSNEKSYNYFTNLTTNIIDTLQISFENTAGNVTEAMDNTLQQFFNNSTPDKNEKILQQTTTPELPALPAPIQIPELTLQTTDRASQEDFKHKFNSPLQLGKKRSSSRNFSWYGDSPHTLGTRQNRLISQNIQHNRGKNLSIFNKACTTKYDSIYAAIPFEIYHQKYNLVKASINISKNQDLTQSAELATQVFENYRRYFLQDRLEALNILKMIFQKSEDRSFFQEAQDKFQEVQDKFQEVTWDLKIIIHEQISDQGYVKVEECIKNVQDVIQRQTPNKIIKNRYQIFLNNDIQEELFSVSQGVVNFNFLTMFDSILKNSFYCPHNKTRKESNYESYNKLTYIFDESATQRCTYDFQFKMTPKNMPQIKQTLINQHNFIIKAIGILRRYTEQSLKQNTYMDITDNPHQLEFHQLTEQLSNPSFVNLFLIIWKSVFKFFGQNLQGLSKMNIGNNSSQKTHENVILSIHDATDDTNIYDTIFILKRMKPIIQEFKIKVIMRLVLKESQLIDLHTQTQIFKQAQKYVEATSLSDFISVFAQNNKLLNHLRQIHEPIKYLGYPIFVEKI